MKYTEEWLTMWKQRTEDVAFMILQDRMDDARDLFRVYKKKMDDELGIHLS